MKKLVVPNIVRILPQLSNIVGKYIFYIIICVIYRIVLVYGDVENFSFKEFRNVENDGEDNDGDDILGYPTVDAATPDSISVVERVADSEVSEDENNVEDAELDSPPLQGYGHSESYGAADGDVVQGVQQLGEDQSIVGTLSIKRPGKD